MKLRLSDDIAFPIEAVTKTFGILAMRGAGKSNAAAVMAEAMYRARLPFCVIDPVGAWWGLRSSSDGTGPGLAIPIFGGYHGDVPLERGGAELVADLIVDESLSCVVDVSAFESERAKREFLTAFAERLFRRKGQPGKGTPLHLFLEEADDYAPQRHTGPDMARCLGAFQRIVKQGRARGLGSTMITQRSASLNKDLLSQIETLIVLRTTAPQDRKAIEAWVEYHALSDELLESLSGLKSGEAWVWSPWLNVVKRTQIHRRGTFDSGATPTLQSSRASATLADVDLESVRKQMATTIERHKAEDPRELKKRIAELERAAKVKTTDTVKPCNHADEIRQLRQHAKNAETEYYRHRAGVAKAATSLAKIAEQLSAIAKKLTNGDGPATTLDLRSFDTPTGRTVERRIAAPERAARKVQTEIASSGDLDGVQQRIVNTIAMLCERDLPRTRDAVARWMGVHPNGGRFNRSLARLRESGRLDGFVLTDQGLALVQPIATGIDALLDALQEDTKRRIVRELMEVKGSLSREQLAERLGIHPNGGRFNRDLAWLRAMGVLPERGPIQLVEGAYR